MIGGSFIAAIYDLSFDAVGYTMILINNICTAALGVYTKQKLEAKVRNEKRKRGESVICVSIFSEKRTVAKTIKERERIGVKSIRVLLLFGKYSSFGTVRRVTFSCFIIKLLLKNELKLNSFRILASMVSCSTTVSSCFSQLFVSSSTLVICTVRTPSCSPTR